jgi:hypothetical protein
MLPLQVRNNTIRNKFFVLRPLTVLVNGYNSLLVICGRCRDIIVKGMVLVNSRKLGIWGNYETLGGSPWSDAIFLTKKAGFFS